MRRKRNWLLLGALLAFVPAGIAVAHEAPVSTKTLTADVTATTKTSLTTKTCVGTTGTVEHTHGTYAGTSTSTEHLLTGPITLHVDSTYNTTAKLGTLKASWSVDAAGPGVTKGKLSAVNSDGSLSGWIEGKASGGRKISGTFSGTWTKDAGFAGPLKLGGVSAPTVLVFSSGKCKK